MMNKNERMEKLNQAGINTSKYFTVNLDNGTKIHLIIDENGQPVVVDRKNDEITEQIIADGYVRNTKLHRRFVMAQMFQMLNYESYDGHEEGFNACLRNRYGYHYTLTMMLEEVRVLSKLEKRDVESFNERSHFFTKRVVVDVLCDYVEKLQNYVDNLPTKNCKGVPYKRIKGKNLFVDDLSKKLYRPMIDEIKRIGLTTDYSALYNRLSWFMKDVVKLPYNTPKSKVWIDAFKGEGAYYTLKNLVMFHDCVIYTGKYGVFNYDKGANLRGADAVNHLNNKLDEYKGEGWRMFALMKKVIADNNFNFNDRMEEIYSEK
jgi:hypothetical protein